MRLVSYSANGAQTAGVLVGEEVLPAAVLGAPPSVRELLAELGADALRALGERAERLAGEGVAIGDVALAAPVPDPQKVICIGLNYRDHAEESGQEIPPAPMWFAKFANSLCGTGADIVLPSAHPDFVDYEAELALVIGRAARNVPPSAALAHLAGVMPFNDVSARDLQIQNPLWTSGKAIDTFAPCGPALVTLDEAGDLQNLSLYTRIDGEVVQEGNTSGIG